MKNAATITAMLNPVTRERVRSTIPAGSKLSDFFTIPDGVILERNGYPYHDEPIESGDLLNIVVPPSGGDTAGKSPARWAGVVGLTAAGIYLTGGATLLGSTTFASFVGTGALMGANALIPPEAV